MHSQLKIKYPTCPFLWNYNDLRQVYSAQATNVNRKDLFSEIDLMINDVNKYKTLSPTNKQTIDFLIRITDSDRVSNYDKITYSIIEQVVPQNLRNSWINFHTTAYTNDHDTFISQEYESVISWCLIPIYGGISTRKGGYIINRGEDINKTERQDIYRTNDMAKALDPLTYKGAIDNNYYKEESVVRNNRVGNRNFVRRDEEEIIEKKDTYVNSSEIHPTNYISPRSRLIVLDNNTRSNAGFIRDNLSSEGRAYRFRTNPETFEHQKKIDLYLKNISQNVADFHNSQIVQNELIERDDFDYIFEKINIIKVSGILRFSPDSSGKITINNDFADKQDKYLSFITILRHKKNLHITLHKIELV
jgi:hypothetical protein